MTARSFAPEHSIAEPVRVAVLASCTMYVGDPDGNEVECICTVPAL